MSTNLQKNLRSAFLVFTVIAGLGAQVGLSHAATGTRLPEVKSPIVHLQVSASVGPNHSLSGAMVEIRNAQGTIIGKGLTNVAGSLVLQLPDSVRTHLPLRFTTTGGVILESSAQSINGPSFDGTLRGQVTKLPAGQHTIVFLDLLSTTASAMRSKTRSYASAMKAVRTGLAIGKGFPDNGLRFTNNHVHWSLEQTAMNQYGGYDQFIQHLVTLLQHHLLITELTLPVTQTNSQTSASPYPQCQAALGNGSNKSGTASTTNIVNYGSLSIEQLIVLAGSNYKVQAAAAVTGMLLTGGASGSGATPSYVNAVSQQLACISSQLSYLSEQVAQLTLMTAVAPALACGNSLEFQYNLYQGLVDAAEPNADGTPSANPLNGTNKALLTDLPGWGSLATSCGSSINNMLMGTAGGQASAWRTMNQNYQIPANGGSKWATALQVQQLQEFLSYWGTLEYYQFVLTNEYYNYEDNPNPTNAQSQAGNVTETTLCKNGTTATSPTYCAWQSNILNAFPGNLYSDEIGVWSNGLAANAYPGGLATLLYGPLYGSTILPQTQTGLTPNELVELYQRVTGVQIKDPNQQYYYQWNSPGQDWNWPAANVTTPALDYFNIQGINPSHLASAVETFTNPQAPRTQQVTAAQMADLNGPGPKQANGEPLTATQFFINAFNQDPSSQWATVPASGAGFYSSDNVSRVVWYWICTHKNDISGQCDGKKWALEVDTYASVNAYNSKNNNPTPSTPNDNAMLGRSWWPGAATATSYQPPPPLTSQSTLPGPVDALTAKGVSSGSIELRFSPPSNTGGQPITGYLATCVHGFGTSVQASSMSSPLTITVQFPGEPYQCNVQAQNIVGLGAAASNPVSASTPTLAAGVPSPPKVNSASPTVNGTVISFTAPSNQGSSPISNYYASCSAPNTTTLTVSGTTASPLTLTGLTPGIFYECTVKARNSYGLSYTSNARYVTTSYTTGAVPGPPTLTDTTPSSATSIVVTFTAPSYPGWSAITGYNATCVAPNGRGTTVEGRASPLTVKGTANQPLGSGVTYSCTVTATNGSGPSDPSNAMFVTTY